jgi:phosphoribosyl-ATP pyrophosphohydrolase
VNDKNEIETKLKEELTELLEAEKQEEIIWEAADLLFFLLVYLENRRITLSRVFDELRRRRGK